MGIVTTDSKYYSGIAEKIREKAGTDATYKPSEMPSGIDKVYSAGQSSMVDESKLIPKTISGSYISVDDVSEIPHGVGCKVESVNLMGLNDVDETRAGVTIKTIGGSLFLDGAIRAGYEIGTNTTRLWFKPILLPAGIYTYTVQIIGAGEITEAMLRTNDDALTRLYSEKVHSGSPMISRTFTLNEPTSVVGAMWLYNTTYDNTEVRFWLNEGTTALPYTPYVKPEEVSVTRTGKNLLPSMTKTSTSGGVTVALNDDKSLTISGTTTVTQSSLFPVINWSATEDTAAVIAIATNPGYSGVQVCIIQYDNEGNQLTYQYASHGYKITLLKECKTIRVWLYVTPVFSGEAVTIYPTLELGAATAYEPYTAQTLTPSTDGTVEGMTSVSPYMNVFSDTEGVNIEATYNKSYGMQTEYDRFWDAFQSNGELETYGYSFAYSKWNDKTFRPKYDIKPSSGNYMFAYNNTTNTATNGKNVIQDLADCLKKAGVVLDTSNTIYFQRPFYMGGGFTHIPAISFESCANLDAVFYQCTNLHTIDKLILKADGTNVFLTADYERPFFNCSSLKNITVEGVIGNSVSFQWCPLTKASITNIINTLSSTITGQTLTLKLSAVNTAFETSTGAGDGSTSAEFAALVATKTNWTITMV